VEISGLHVNPLKPGTTIGALKPNTESKGAADIAESFSRMLEQAMNNFEHQEKNVSALNEGFISGKEVDVHNMMIASEKLQLGLQLTVQVRNKVIEAYQEIMRTQL
jgi:flagellar hook-basal body complex protein FliE